MSQTHEEPHESYARANDEIQRLRRALQKIANLPLEKTETFKCKSDPIVRARKVAVMALRANQ